MIDKDDIIKLSKLHGLRPWQEEKRYMLSVVLNAIYDEPLIFKGDTYLWLFHGLRRFSEDLDFTENSMLKGNLPDKVSEELKLQGINNELKIVKNDNITLSFRLLSEGPLYTNILSMVPVYIEISRREKIIKQAMALNFDFPEYNLPIRILSGMNLDEVAAEKVRAIYTRKKARDIYDLYYLIYFKKVIFEPELINMKLKFYNIIFDKMEFINEILKQKKIFSNELKPIVMGEIPEIQKIIEIVSSWINI